MQQSGEVLYLDSSALVKLVIHETESDSLTLFIAEHPFRASCDLARVEIVRAVQSHGDSAARRAGRLLRGIALRTLSPSLLDRAAEMQPGSLRSLDAIHLAAAESFLPSLRYLITYDDRMIRAAERLGLPTVAPGR